MRLDFPKTKLHASSGSVLVSVSQADAA